MVRASEDAALIVGVRAHLHGPGSAQAHPLERLDATAARRWAVLSRAALAAHRRELDALNVFPVPDGDTGTNLFLTFDAAMDSARVARDDAPTSLPEAAEALASATLASARGNSGVILSQIVRGLAEVVAAEGEALDGRGLALALARASELASASVSRPAPGTILSVASQAGAAALRAAGVDAESSSREQASGEYASGEDAGREQGSCGHVGREQSTALARPSHQPIAQPEGDVLAQPEGDVLADRSLYAVTQSALATAGQALIDTMAELPELTAAGVVDAGAAGYVLLLQALAAVVSGEVMEHESPPPPSSTEGRHEKRPGWPERLVRASGESPDRDLASRDLASRDLARRDLASGGEASIREASSEPGDSGAGPAYEVMFLLSDCGQEDTEALRRALADLGDSVVVAGGTSGPRGAGVRASWHVHAHVDDVGAAIEAGMRAGRPHRIRVASLVTPPEREPRLDTVGVVAWAAGPGLGRVFTDAGAMLVRGGAGRRPSTADLLEAVQAAGTSSVLILPNDSNVRLAAENAVAIAADRGIVAYVVRSRAAVQGIAAMAVFEAAGTAQDNLVAMTSAAAAARQGAVMVATREALTSAGWCYAGDVLGIVDDDIVTIGTDLAAVAGIVVDRLLGGGGEILTVISGQDAPPGLANVVGDAARRRRRDIELAVLDGGQPLHHLLIGVE